MYELSGKIQGVGIDFFTRKATVQFMVYEEQTLKEMYDQLHDCERIKIKVDKWKNKRSLDANGYFWVLADKLAEKTGTSKEQIYRDAIRNIGGNSEIVCVQDKAVEKLCESWRRNGIGWQTDTLPSKIEGCTNVVLYYGSSTYDTAQMARLIDNIVQDCKAVGIETLTDREIASIKDKWEAK